MGCGCCGGPLVGGTGFATTVKYNGDTGNVMWWVDSGRANNAGVYHGGVYYELAGSLTSPTPLFLRTLNATTGEELLRRTFSPAFTPGRLYVNGGNLYVIGGGVVVHKINTTDLSSYWSVTQVPDSTPLSRRIIVQDDEVVTPALVGGVAKWRQFSSGTLGWEINVSGNVDRFHFIDGSGQYVGSTGVTLKRYDGTPSLVDSYTASSTILNAVLDGSDIWVRSTSHAQYVDSSLSDNFSPAATTDTGSGMITPFSGGAYFFGSRYINRITTAGSVSQRLDYGGTTLRAWLWRGDQSTFQAFATTAVIKGYDDGSAPASLDWTSDPSLVLTSTDTSHCESINNGNTVSFDADGNFYVTGTRLADTTLDKVP